MKPYADASGAVLFAPESFIKASVAMRYMVCNGCGPGGWLAAFVPDTIWGLPIRAACNIHDWMYAEGKTHEDKLIADRVFKYNLLRMIENAGGWWWLQALRRRRALIYFNVVDQYGGPWFWARKNPESHLVFAAEAV